MNIDHRDHRDHDGYCDHGVHSAHSDHSDRGDHGNRDDHGDFFIALTGSSSGQGVKRRLEERPADGMLGEELQEQVWSCVVWSSLALSGLV